ncbi:MAG: threonine synthase [Candidatus Micrarchaeia archaeon]
MFSIARYKLKCRECGAEYAPTERTVCDDCFGPVKVAFDLAEAGATFTKENIARRPLSLWRYFELLPVDDKSRIVDLGAGYTPLIHAQKLGQALGLRRLYIKNDSVNPTFSFKDRPVTVGITKAIEFGKKVISCASTGNLAASSAAHAAKAGLPCFVFIPADIELAKIAQIFAYGAHVIAVNGIYDVANRLSNEAADRFGWAVLNVNIRPYYAEGEKTIAFETCEQLGWELPDAVVVPIGSGGLLCEVEKAFRELRELRLVPDENVRFYGAQGEGADAVIRAVKNGGPVVPIKNPKTIAKSIMFGAPGDGEHALRIIRETRGGGENPSDAEILEGIRLLAHTEGILTEPAGGTTIAALKRLAEAGAFDANEVVVAFITGNGLKTQEAIPRGKVYRINPRIEEVEKVLRKVRAHGKGKGN